MKPNGAILRRLTATTCAQLPPWQLTDVTAEARLLRVEVPGGYAHAVQWRHVHMDTRLLRPDGLRCACALDPTQADGSGQPITDPQLLAGTTLAGLSALAFAERTPAQVAQDGLLAKVVAAVKARQSGGAGALEARTWEQEGKVD